MNKNNINSIRKFAYQLKNKIGSGPILYSEIFFDKDGKGKVKFDIYDKFLNKKSVLYVDSDLNYDIKKIK